MRRILSISLLVVLGIGLGLPFVQAQETVPACCRRDGKHHCNANMGASGESSGLPGFKSAVETCPYRHHPALTSEQSALTATPHQIGIFVFCSEALQPTESNFYSNRPNDAHKRGPPAA